MIKGGTAPQISTELEKIFTYFGKESKGSPLRRAPRELERISNSNNPSWARGGPRDPRNDIYPNGKASIDAIVF